MVSCVMYDGRSTGMVDVSVARRAVMCVVVLIQLFCVARLSPCTYVRNFFVVGDVEYRYDDL